MHINRVAGKLSTNGRVFFCGAELGYPSPTQNLKRRVAQAF
jgi:hypothetical protein